MSREFSNYILSSFLPTECVAIEEIAIQTFKKSLEKYPNDGWKPLEKGQAAPLPFLANAIAIWQVIRTHVKIDLHKVEPGTWDSIRFAVRAYLGVAASTIDEERLCPRIPTPGVIGDTCHVEEWYEANLYSLDKFVQEWRANSCREGVDPESGESYATTWPLEMETSQFDEGWLFADDSLDDENSLLL